MKLVLFLLFLFQFRLWYISIIGKNSKYSLVSISFGISKFPFEKWGTFFGKFFSSRSRILYISTIVYFIYNFWVFYCICHKSIYYNCQSTYNNRRERKKEKEILLQNKRLIEIDISAGSVYVRNQLCIVDHISQIDDRKCGKFRTHTLF